MSKKPRIAKKRRQPRRGETDRVADGCGPDCPSCGKTTTRWRWPDYREKAKEMGKPVYRWWFLCMNPACRTYQVMPGPEALFDPRKEAQA
jgi:hypothetical protein